MMHRRLFTGFAWLTFALFCAAGPALAGVGSQEATLKGETHLGRPEDAVVGIEATDRNRERPGVVVNRGNGFILRCDGFVLAPSSLLGPVRSSSEVRFNRKPITVVLYPGSDRERRVTALAPAWIAAEAGYAVIKLADVHLPAVSAVLPEALKPGDKASVYFSAWDGALGRFRKTERRDTNLGEAPQDPSKLTPGAILFSMPLDAVPLGAMVIGPSDSAVGMVTAAGPGARTFFTSFGNLHRATNCVSPATRLPAPASRIQDGPPANDSAAKAEMVRVPGGKIELPASVTALHPDLNGARTACVAPFEIDKYEVTNEQYLRFWNGLPEEVRRSARGRELYYPVGWGDLGQPFPPALAKLPVLGVTTEAAATYARSEGKRLPTPYEWCLAAFGPKGESAHPEWAKRFVSERNAAWREAAAAHEGYLHRNRNLIESLGHVIPWFKDGIDRLRSGSAPDRPAAEVQSRELTAASAWSKSIFEPLLLRLFREWRKPLHVLPVGSRNYDVSPYGAYDMTLNAAEAVIPFPGGPPRGLLPPLSWESAVAPQKALYMQIEWAAPELRKMGGSDLFPQPHWWNHFQETPVVPVAAQYISRFISLGKGNRPPYAIRHTVLAARLFEIADLIRPISGWETRLIPGPTQACGYPIGFLNGTFFTYNILTSPVYGLWVGLPHGFEQEMGRPLPVRPSDLILVPPALEESAGGRYNMVGSVFLIPGGIRCAR